MTKRWIAIGLLATSIPIVSCTGTKQAPARHSPAASAAFRSVPELKDITLRGELGTRWAAATANLLTRPDRYSLDSYRANASGTPGALWPDWPGDQFGRMYSVMHVSEGYGWTTVPALRQAIAGVVLPLQTEDGNFGPRLAR